MVSAPRMSKGQPLSEEGEVEAELFAKEQEEQERRKRRRWKTCG